MCKEPLAHPGLERKQMLEAMEAAERSKSDLTSRTAQKDPMRSNLEGTANGRLAAINHDDRPP
jgi:hypothetical protein